MAPLRRRCSALATALLALACGASEPEPAAESAAATEAEKPAAPAAAGVPTAELDAEEQRRMDELLALGYVQGSEPVPDVERVSLYDREKAWPGLNLATSAHGPEAELFDMEGRVLHRWQLEYQAAWPERKETNWYRGDRYWRRTYLYPNGDLLAIFDGLGLVKVDRDSNLLWTYENHAHHDLFVREDGSIYVLTRQKRIIPRINPEEEVWEDFVTVLDPEGNELRSVSLFEAVANSAYAGWLEGARTKGDIFHTNTLEVLDGRLAGLSEAFRAGNVLLSFHSLHAIGVLDMETGLIGWGLTGPWRFQHQPTVLDNGNLLLFDNLGTPKRSSVIELDPATGEERWRYQAAEENVFFSLCCGSNQRLPNGNTLVTDSEKGRAFELTPDGEIVWEYWNPHRFERKGEERIATLYEVQRLPADFPLDWLPANGDGADSP